MSMQSPESREISLTESIELSTSVMLIAHIVVMIASLIIEVTIFGAPGVLIGIGIALVLAALMFPIVLPASYVIGWSCHRLFSQTNVGVATLVRTITILFEANLLGWILYLSLMLH